MRRSPRALPLSLLLLALGAAEALAQTPSAPASEGLPTGALRHDAALRLAAERNLGLLARKLDKRRFEAESRVARRPYVPELGMEGAYRRGGGYGAVEWIPRVSYATPFGTTMSAAAAFSEGVGDSKESQRSLTIELTQALLRGGPAGSGADLDQADLDVRIAHEAFRGELNALLVRADRAYWEVVFARGDLDVKRRSRDRARTQFEETRENIRRGLLAPGEIFVVEENLVDFEERLSRAEESLALAQSGLRRILGLHAAWPVEPPDGAVEGALAEPTEADSLGIALARNADVGIARLAVERARVGVGGDKRAAYPELDAFGSVGKTTGSDATGAPVPEYADIRTGLRLTVPLYWGPDVARIDRARIEHGQRRIELRDAEEGALAAVRDAATRLRGRKQRLDLATRIVELSQKKLDVERDKYKSGLSTLADVVRFQRELDGSLTGALRTRIDVLTARAELFAARGDLHERAGVSVK